MLPHMAMTILAYKQLPDSVTSPLHQMLDWLLWGVWLALLARLVWVGGRLGWEHFRPPPGPPESGGDLVRSLVAWVIASAAWPIATELLFNSL
jgi:hypothetical protein